MYLATTAQRKETDRIAIQERGIPPLDLMECAASAGEVTVAGIGIPEDLTPPAVLPGCYRHFKGREYQVLGTARHSETEEPMAVYRALYGEQRLWVCPAALWNEIVERDGRHYLRFACMGE